MEGTLECGAFGMCELKDNSSRELTSLEGQQLATLHHLQLPWGWGQASEKSSIGLSGQSQEDFLRKSLCLCFRIAGDTALNKNIHESVSAQIRKNFAKSKWRVSPKCVCFMPAQFQGNLNHSGQSDSSICACGISK